MTKRIIPIFFATDDAYAPLLGVALTSLLSNADSEYFYRIHILTTGFNEYNAKKLVSLSDDKSEIRFEDMSKVLRKYGNKFHFRDYYSVATYYRLFIAELFKNYDKALYFDSDMIFLGDISKLFNIDMQGKLVAGVQESVMQLPVFGTYSEKVLGVPRADYINAGMLLMDLKALREFDLENKFMKKISEVTYTVAQDQDYINSILKGKILMLEDGWNLTASGDIDCKDPKIVHFKLIYRPWRYRGIVYDKAFWKYAKKSGYFDDLKEIFKSHTVKDKENDRLVMEKLAETAYNDVVKVFPDIKTSDFLLNENEKTENENR